MNVTHKPGWSHTLLYDTVYDNLNKMFLTSTPRATSRDFKSFMEGRIRKWGSDNVRQRDIMYATDTVQYVSMLRSPYFVRAIKCAAQEKGDYNINTDLSNLL